MIRNKYFILAAALLLLNPAMQVKAQGDQRTQSTRIADLLTQLPANDAKLLAANMNDILQLGDVGLAALIMGLKAPGAGNNALIEYAAGGFAAFASSGKQENARKMSVAAFTNAIGNLQDKQNKSFLFSQLDLVAKNDAIAILTPYLTDQDLVDPAARALVKIQSAEADQALLTALASSTGQPRLAVINALGDRKVKAAVAEISKSAADQDSQLKKMSLLALARIGDLSSETVLLDAAKQAQFVSEDSYAVSSLLIYATNLARSGNGKAAAGLVKKIDGAAQKAGLIDLRTAALAIRIIAEPEQKTEILQKALKEKDAQYRGAVIELAMNDKNAADMQSWVKQFDKYDAARQTELLTLFASGKNADALPVVLKAINSKDQQLRNRAIQTAAIVGQQNAVPALLDALPGKDAQETDAIVAALNKIKGEQLINDIAAYIPKAKPEVQIPLLKVLALRRANSQVSNIQSLMGSSNHDVKTAAYATLNATVNSGNLPALFAMLKASHSPQELESVRDGIIAALKGNVQGEQQTDQILTEMNSAPADRKALYYNILSSVGGQKALAAVKQDYTSGTPDQQKAALNALAGWSDQGAMTELIKIAAANKDESVNQTAIGGYLRLIGVLDVTPEQKLLLVREGMAVAVKPEQKQQFLRQLGSAKTFNALVFAGKYLDDPALQQAAAQAIMNIAIADKSLNGSIVRNLIEKTMGLLTGGDSDYEKEGLRKLLAEMPAGEGFVTMFNGTDLTGWQGLVENPVKRAQMNAKTLAAAQQKANIAMLDSWKVKDGEIQFTAHGENLATVKKYGDFEMLVDWKIIDDGKQKGDAGIYLRGSPQVQIWDNSMTNVGAQVGSGGLYNNQVNESIPLKIADNKLDEWNTFRIIMKGDRVTVYLNGVLVTDNVILENYWDRSMAIFAEEQIELQAHGSPIAYRDLYIREIPRPQPFVLSANEKKEGFKVLFDGTNMHEWQGNTTDYIIENGNLAIRTVPGKGSGGNLFTKKEYGDFIFRFEFKLTPGANNGLGIRAPLTGDAAYEGMELQILDDDAPIYKELEKYQYHGSVYGTLAAKRGGLKPVGEWNYEEVVVKGPKIKVILNGTVILDGDLTEARKNGAADGKPHPGLSRDKGYIGFLGHGSPVDFRNIRIKDLSKAKK
ncbi:DUF1080 domain-containing protein [Pedobacter antarcticus]|uniref:DUF1080 domain-containing protein n=1 Tax=Pedobacter antarcticus TaxID=34086 RepID=UPI00087E9D00|nr:family 16 glycoside hydrolase [Pedobacter antarcticus]SDM72709.1 HEAT repeat [Pedobacter antarcticus]